MLLVHKLSLYETESSNEGIYLSFVLNEIYERRTIFNANYFYTSYFGYPLMSVKFSLILKLIKMPLIFHNVFLILYDVFFNNCQHFVCLCMYGYGYKQSKYIIYAFQVFLAILACIAIVVAIYIVGNSKSKEKQKQKTN